MPNPCLAHLAGCPTPTESVRFCRVHPCLCEASAGAISDESDYQGMIDSDPGNQSPALHLIRPSPYLNWPPKARYFTSVCWFETEEQSVLLKPLPLDVSLPRRMILRRVLAVY